MSAHLVIAIDGPSGSGKSSTSRRVAQRLGCAYLDTGSIYRALTLWCVTNKITSDQSDEVRQAAQALPIQITPDPAEFRVILGGRDITDQLHESWVNEHVSNFAAIKPARTALITLMRQIIDTNPRIVVEGRDITTVVAPDANVRVLLQADPAERVARRTREVRDLDNESATAEMIGRDKKDAKTTQFERPADDGVTVIDSTHLSLDDVTQAVIDLVPQTLR